jgi:hypothetical protein
MIGMVEGLAVAVAWAVVLGVPTGLLLGGFFTKAFPTPPELAWARHLFGAAAVVPSALLASSLTMTWHEIYDYDMETTVVMDGRHALARTVVFAGWGCAALAVAGVHGRRNWAPSTLVVAWVLLGLSWLTSFGSLESSSEVHGGLPTATLGVVALTVLVVAGFLLRDLQLIRTERTAAAR